MQGTNYNYTRWFAGAVAGLLIFLAGYYAGGNVVNKCGPGITQDGTDYASVHILLDSGDDTVVAFKNVALSSTSTVFDVISRVSQEKNLSLQSKDYGDMGILVERINGKPVSGDSRYWQYWVNGEYAMVSASKYPVKTGDVILWKLAKESPRAQ